MGKSIAELLKETQKEKKTFTEHVNEEKCNELKKRGKKKVPGMKY